MRIKLSLRQRIAGTYAVLAMLVCTFMAAVVFFAIDEVQEDIVDRQLEHIAAWQLSLQRPGQTAPLPQGWLFYSGADIPAGLANLPIGTTARTIDGSETLLLRGQADGMAFVVGSSIGIFEEARREILAALAAAVLASAVLALILGSLAAGRVIAPLTELAQAVTTQSLDRASSTMRLDDEIGVLARALATHTEALQRFLQREQFFTGDVSHELRTPLAVILGASEVLATRLADRPELAPVVDRIRRTASDTADRIGALLLLSRTPERLDAAPVALAEVVRREVDRYRHLLDGKAVELRVDAADPVVVSTRSELVSMAVGNLIRNAFQYTERGLITVCLHADGLAIEDTGPGVPAHVRSQLFERFVSGRHDRSGSGLGLAIVKRICDHLRWQVRLEDRVSGGSRFSLQFDPVEDRAAGVLTKT